jgi:hypothetical protein
MEFELRALNLLRKALHHLNYASSPSFFFFFCVCVVLGFELRAYTLSYSISPFLCCIFAR